MSKVTPPSFCTLCMGEKGYVHNNYTGDTEKKNRSKIILVLAIAT